MHILAEGLLFPEGPVALPDGSVLVVEVAGEAIRRVAPNGTVSLFATVPGAPNGLGVGPDGQLFLCNNGGLAWKRQPGRLMPLGQPAAYETGRIEVIGPEGGKPERLYDRCDGHALRAPNDLVFDADGNFWFTDYGKKRDRDMDRGFVYWARADGSEIRQVIGPMLSPNGIGLSPDGRTLYVAETETARLWAWEVVAPGRVDMLPFPSPHGGRLVCGMGGFNRLDSLAVTASGRVCVAALHRGSVAEIDPATGLFTDHVFPDTSVTNICFGGHDMRTAYVTLAHQGLLATTRWAEPGLRLAFQDLPPV
ncbi:SMP-30/gluconolactonase/LRE family protein [Aureimonas flava]|uniref:SMP-30/gluconolactonase/LRE family protein n=1 Tax=Aureimonas flava TaxID=2320271 RepID=A0A3A1WRF7_9HYPH|nr:SMP-30/gluconolactonase/LRE family protein [Aureimonas flava]RIX99728.1 SMP-30/gluconolactonase/LRE family protein [Aureimonas flava]